MGNIVKVGNGISKAFMTIVTNEEARAFAVALAPTVATIITTKITQSHETARHSSEHKKDLMHKEVDTIHAEITKCDEEMATIDPKSQRYQDLKEIRAELVQMLKAAFNDIRYFTDSVVASANPVIYVES